jgi:hypothetical protein
MLVRELRKVLATIADEAIVEAIVIQEPRVVEPLSERVGRLLEDERWYAWYMDYLWAFVGVAFVYVLAFIVGLIPVYAGWVSADVFNHAALIVAKYSASLAGIIGSIWALWDYQRELP